MSMSVTAFCAASVEKSPASPEVGKFLDVDVTDYIEYDTPDGVPEWDWIESISSFSHKENGVDGIWEFMVNVAHLEQDTIDVPSALLEPIRAAVAGDCQYILFHQGT